MNAGKQRIKLGIVVPTIHVDFALSTFLPSLAALRPLTSMCDVRVLYHFQPPWTKASISKAIALTELAGLTGMAVYSEPPRGAVSMASLRAAAAELWRGADYFMFADDNLEFREGGTPQYPLGSAARYGEVLEYFQAFPRCGAVMCVHSLGGHWRKAAIGPTSNGLIGTERGLFIRNAFRGAVFSEAERSLIGGLEETIAVYRLVRNGYFVARQFNCPTRHHHKKKGQQWDLSQGEEYVRAEYTDLRWKHSSSKFPFRLKWHDLFAKDELREHTIDYTHRQKGLLT